jgi:2'-5' RNA ligase
LTGQAAVGARPLIVTATFGTDDFAWLEGLRRQHFPPERNRVPVHITLFHHLAPSLLAELRERLGTASASPPPRASITGVMDLGGGTAFRVASEELEDIRAELAAAFRGMLTPQDQARWRPHITVQNKVERREASALQKVLQAGLFPRPLAIRGLASWRYLGGPWEPLRTYPFRG